MWSWLSSRLKPMSGELTLLATLAGLAFFLAMYGAPVSVSRAVWHCSITLFGVLLVRVMLVKP